MRGFRSRKTMVAAAIAVCALALSVSAAVMWLSPSQIARELKNEILAEAFESEDAVALNETQRAGAYDVTLLGLVSGKGLDKISEELGSEKTYVALRVERADGTAIEEHPGELTFTPLVAGYPVHHVNAFTLGGGYNAFMEDGAVYYLFETGSIEMFADRNVYFAVYEGFAPSTDQFEATEDTIRYAPGEEGALFTLPLDASKADPAAAAQLVREMWGDEDELGAENEVPLTAEKIGDEDEPHFVIKEGK